MGVIPTDFTQFLTWMKEQTEEAWASYRARTFEDFQRSKVGGNDWRRGTRWSGGLTEDEISTAEQRWQLKFPPDYRHFLELLGTPDRPMFAVRWNNSEMVEGDAPSFYDWRKDIDSIGSAVSQPLEGLVFDVEHNNLWLDSWGIRPKTTKSRRQRLSGLLREAPPLIPLIGHRYLVGAPLTAGNIVISVHQADIIVYGADLRRFLLVELSSLLDLNYFESYRAGVEGIPYHSIGAIPFWGELITRVSARSSC